MESGGHADEIRELRRRLYGAGGDLAGDAAAQARLDGLEGRVPSGSSGPGTTEPALPTPPVEPPASRDEAAPAAVIARVRGARRRILLALAWVASLVLAVAVGASITDWQRGPAGSDVAVLPLSAENPIPAYAADQSREGVTASADFHGLTVIRQQPNIAAPQVDGGCLRVVPTERIGRAAQYSVFGCGAGPFPVSVPLRVATTSPADLKTAFPVGTTLRFVLEGDAVRVLSAAP